MNIVIGLPGYVMRMTNRYADISVGKKMLIPFEYNLKWSHPVEPSNPSMKLVKDTNHYDVVGHIIHSEKVDKNNYVDVRSIADIGVYVYRSKKDALNKCQEYRVTILLFCATHEQLSSKLEWESIRLLDINAFNSASN